MKRKSDSKRRTLKGSRSRKPITKKRKSKPLRKSKKKKKKRKTNIRKIQNGGYLAYSINRSIKKIKITYSSMESQKDKENLTNIGKNSLDKLMLSYKEYKTRIKDIDLSDCKELKKIDDNYFEGLVNLTNINLPLNIKFLGDNCFMNCKSLKSINLSQCVHLKNIGKGCFMNCLSLKSIDLSNCSELQISGPEKKPTYQTIYEIFENCKSMEKIILPVKNQPGIKKKKIEEYNFNKITEFCNLCEEKNIECIIFDFDETLFYNNFSYIYGLADKKLDDLNINNIIDIDLKKHFFPYIKDIYSYIRNKSTDYFVSFLIKNLKQKNINVFIITKKVKIIEYILNNLFGDESSRVNNIPDKNIIFNLNNFTDQIKTKINRIEYTDTLYVDVSQNNITRVNEDLIGIKTYKINNNNGRFHNPNYQRKPLSGFEEGFNGLIEYLKLLPDEWFGFPLVSIQEKFIKNLKTNKIKCIIFDFDDTLFKSNYDYLNINIGGQITFYNDFRRENSIKLSVGFFDKYYTKYATKKNFDTNNEFYSNLEKFKNTMLDNLYRHFEFDKSDNKYYLVKLFIEIRKKIPDMVFGIVSFGSAQIIIEILDRIFQNSGLPDQRKIYIPEKNIYGACPIYAIEGEYLEVKDFIPTYNSSDNKGTFNIYENFHKNNIGIMIHERVDFKDLRKIPLIYEIIFQNYDKIKYASNILFIDDDIKNTNKEIWPISFPKVKALRNMNCYNIKKLSHTKNNFNDNTLDSINTNLLNDLNNTDKGELRNYIPMFGEFWVSDYHPEYPNYEEETHIDLNEIKRMIKNRNNRKN